MAGGEKLHIFDTDYPNGTLANWFPSDSEILDFSKTGGQVKLFDTIISKPDTNFIIDLQSELLEKFFRIFDDIDFVESADGQNMRVVVYYVVDKTQSSWEKAVQVYESVKHGEFYPVYNEYISPQFDLTQISVSAGGVTPLREVYIPKLSDVLYAMIHQREFDLPSFLLGKGDPNTEVLNSEFWSFLQSLYENRKADKKGITHLL